MTRRITPPHFRRYRENDCCKLTAPITSILRLHRRLLVTMSTFGGAGLGQKIQKPNPYVIHASFLFCHCTPSSPWKLATLATLATPHPQGSLEIFANHCLGCRPERGSFPLDHDGTPYSSPNPSLACHSPGASTRTLQNLTLHRRRMQGHHDVLSQMHQIAQRLQRSRVSRPLQIIPFLSHGSVRTDVPFVICCQPWSTQCPIGIGNQAAPSSKGAADLVEPTCQSVLSLEARFSGQSRQEAKGAESHSHSLAACHIQDICAVESA